ncbi:hypothetical protein [Pontibacter liquoris]|uniref:hypothetical protein n=1 Tax=Pontibacter liquoris TaxID=2905677 RepID=UPI001FA7F8FD|nr:hypothetical protein [Pontibacter liquoris]
MNPAELEERLSDAERVLALHGKRLEKVEQLNAPAPARPEQDNAELTKLSPDISNQFEELKKLISRQDLSTQALQIYAQIASFRETITQLPKVLPVRHHHHFEDRSRGFLIGGVVCLLTVAILTGLCFSLFRENVRLRESSAKYEMIRQASSEAAIWADSTYHLDPDEVERSVELFKKTEVTKHKKSGL